MSEVLKNLIRGAGTILEIMPARPSRFDVGRRLRTSEEALRSDWARVGLHLRRAAKAAAPKGSAIGQRK